jgi:hypothetical protein
MCLEETVFCEWWTGALSGCSYRKQRGGWEGCVTVGLNPELGLPQQTATVPSHTLRVAKHGTSRDTHLGHAPTPHISQTYSLRGLLQA